MPYALTKNTMNQSRDTMIPAIKSYDEAVAFHGHACPGLALGYRAAQYAMDALRAGRSDDEELVSIV
ncbi:MAG TPA: FmdE family protein, partial [Methanoregula sp.]|nr:FmdE family protein [Methanoregula sp.]